MMLRVVSEGVQRSSAAEPESFENQKIGLIHNGIALPNRANPTSQ